MRTTLALAVVLLAACAAEVRTDVEGLRAALPDEAAIRIGSCAPAPSPEATTDDVIATAPAFGSGYARTTFWSAATVNAGLAWGLGRLRLVVSLPPTSCDELACTWGPWTDREGLNVWRLVVRHDGSGWAFNLDARPGSAPSAPFAPIVAGVIQGGALPGRGHGSLQMDFEAAAALDHPPGWQQQDFGRLAVQYDARAALRVDATAVGARSRDPEAPQPVNAVYAFRAAEGGAGGELQLAVETLEATPATLSLRSRWDGAGAGRGDAVSSEEPSSESECWSDAASGFALVYDSGATPLVGSEGACAFLPALAATLTPP
jgi:hypothetical protein